MPILGAIGNASEYAYRSNIVQRPNSFDWPNRLNVDPGSVYTAGYAKITGIKSLLPVKVSVGSSYSLYANAFDNRQTVTFDSNRQTFDSFLNQNQRFKSGLGLNDSFYELIGNNESINLRINTPRTLISDFSKTYTTNVSIGNTVQDWIVTTRAFDGTPNPFSFTSIGSTTTLTTVESNQVTIAGIETGFTHRYQITSGIGTIIVNGVSRGTSFNISNGDAIKLQTTTSSSFNINQDIVVEVGTFSTTWSVKTEPENLNIIFSSDFVDQTNLDLSTNTVSNQITLSGFSLNSALPLTLSNTNTSYEIERDASILKSFDSEFTLPVRNNDKIRVRLPSSSSYDTSVSTTVGVGNSSADWTIRTRTAPPPTPTPTPTPTPGPTPGPTPTPAPSTATVTRYYNSTIADHLFSTGTPITSGSITVSDINGSISLSGEQNPIIGESTAGVTRLSPGPGSRVRITVPYAMTSVSLIDNTASGGLANAISSASFSSAGTDSCQNYNVTFVRTDGTGGNARNWRINFSLNGYTVESAGNFKVFTSQQSGTQLLRTSYNNTRTNHETAFSNDEESTGYGVVQNLGYAYPGSTSQPSGTRALYKVVNRSTAAATVGQQYDTLVTLSASEALSLKNSGWTEISSAPGFPGFMGTPYAWVPN